MTTTRETGLPMSAAQSPHKASQLTWTIWVNSTYRRCPRAC